MQPSLVYAASALTAYLLGSVPFGLLIAKSKGINIREKGSGNIGATNVFRSVGKGPGLLTFFLDAAKGFLPAFLLYKLLNDQDASHIQMVKITCAAMSVAGHNFPVFLKFKGGKGIATTAGALIAIAPTAFGSGILIWTVVLLTSRYVSLASIIAAAAIGASSWFLYIDEGLPLPCALSILAVLAIARHHGNIKRLLNGTENRFNFKKNKEDAKNAN